MDSVAPPPNGSRTPPTLLERVERVELVLDGDEHGKDSLLNQVATLNGAVAEASGELGRLSTAVAELTEQIESERSTLGIVFALQMSTAVGVAALLLRGCG